MRTIKFRGKRIDNGEWVEGNLVVDKNGKAHIVRANSSPIQKESNGHWWINSPCYQVDPSTVGQFTGLTDKNGKEIFEGDRVIIIYVDGGGETLTVAFNEDKARFCLHDEDGNTYGFDNTNDLEVIGNIHDKN